MSGNHRSTYVALVAALRAEFDATQRRAIWIQMREHRYDLSSLGTLAQAAHDADDLAYDASNPLFEAGNAAPREAAAQIPDHVLDLVRDLTDDDTCWFDHHGGCQAHGYLSLAGSKCPHAEAKELLALHRPAREGV